MNIDPLQRDCVALGPEHAAGVDGILGAWNAAGVLVAADIHIADRLARMCGEPVSETALLGAALAVRAVRLGSTCLALDRLDDLCGIDVDHELRPPAGEELLQALLSCPLVVGTDAGPLRPLVLMESSDGPLLYLQKYFRQEDTIRVSLRERAASSPVVDPGELSAAIDAVFGAEPSAETADLQRLAAAVVATRWTTVLAGGPGTGKTYTVARILAVLHRVHGSTLRVGLCAPTGRAAAQLQASVSAEVSAGASAPGAGVPSQAVTVHSLLGWYPGSNPRFGRGHTLPHDVIVVDETSMLAMTAMSRILDAARPDARVIFVGDPHQLASVDAGAVLADLVERTGRADVDSERASAATVTAIQAARLRPDQVMGSDAVTDASEVARINDGVITLRRGYRFADGIAAVAAAVNSGDAERVIELLTDPDLTDIELAAPEDLDDTQRDVESWGRELRTAALAGDADGALDALDSHRVLCAHREGYWGVRGWSRRVAQWLGHDNVTEWLGQDAFESSGRYAGQPILVTANDRQTRTFNGDTGVVIADPKRPGPEGLRVAFRRGPHVRLLHPTQLAETTTVHAMTIHRSQGSQFGQVTVVLPPTGSELLTRELLYTAITRAQRKVRIIATPEVVAAAVRRRVQRASGLRSPLTPMLDQPIAQ